MRILLAVIFGISVPTPNVTVGAALSAPLRNTAVRSPMPHGTLGGYAGDTGLDISGHFMPVYAIADGVLEYSEWGHTRWRGPDDTAFSIRLRLDHPLSFGNRRVTHVYYTHLSSVVTEFILREDAVRSVLGGYRNGEVLP